MKEKPSIISPAEEGTRAAREDAALREAMRLAWTTEDEKGFRWSAELTNGMSYEILTDSFEEPFRCYVFVHLANGEGHCIALTDSVERAKWLASLIDVRRIELGTRARPAVGATPLVPKEYGKES